MSNHNRILAFFASITVVAVTLQSASGQDAVLVPAEELPLAASTNDGAAAAVKFPADHLTVTQWVRPSTNEFRGKVIVPMMGESAAAVPNASVVLRGQQGNIYRGISDANGNLLIPNVKPGVYAMTARAPGLFACYAMHVLSGAPGLDGLFPTMAEISCAPITTKAFEATILPHFIENYSRDLLKINESRVAEIANHVRGNEMYNVMQSDAGLAGYIYAATEQGLDLDGGDSSNRLDPSERTHVFLMTKYGSLIGQDITDNEGRFDFPYLPGVYSLLAVGPDGVGVVGFELVGQNPLTAMADPLNDSRERLVLEDGVEVTNGAFAFQVIPLTATELQETVTEPFPDKLHPDELVLLDEFGDPIDCLEEPMKGAHSGMVGGYRGGGGGGGGGGDGFGLLGLIGLAGLAGLSGDDDDDGDGDGSIPFPPDGGGDGDGDGDGDKPGDGGKPGDKPGKPGRPDKPGKPGRPGKPGFPPPPASPDTVRYY